MKNKMQLLLVACLALIAVPAFAQTPVASPATSAASPAKKLADDDVVVKPKHAQFYTLTGPGTLHIAIYGRKHADKGFWVLAKSGQKEAVELQVTTNIKGRGMVEGEKARSFTRDITVPVGPYVVAIVNSENLVEAITVHVRLVMDPAT